MAKVLLIEPDFQLGHTLQSSLKHFGHTVRWCRTAQAAIQASDEQTPDVIVLELQLPTHNGIEFLYEFRSYRDWQAIPVVVHSNVPPTLKAISPMLWDDLKVSAYLYKPHTKLATLNYSIDNVLATA